MERYSKQILFDEIGKEGQKRLNNAKVVVIGCGALGTVVANNLARSGVGYIKIVDRDYIEVSNLQRQILFDEDDIENNLPKAIAAEYKLKKINSDIVVEGIIEDVNANNIIKLCEDMDLILDATDNLNIRYLINDASIKLNIPWIYGAVIGSNGMTHTIIPKKTPCLRCIMSVIPPAGAIETCDTAGVLNTIVNIIASIQCTEAIKLLIGKENEIIQGLRYIDIWNNDFETMEMNKRENCLACGNENFEFLNSDSQDAIFLCGKDSVQVNPINKSISADNIIKRLKSQEIELKRNKFFLKFEVENIQFTLFYDGRAILKNVSDTAKAKTLYSKYIGF